MNPRTPSANEDLARLVAARSRAPRRPARGAVSEPNVPLLLLRIGERWCGLRAEAVREVVAPESITRVPAQPRYLLGVTIVHGRLVPVIHLGELVPGLHAKLDSPSGRRLIVTYDGDVEIGLVADDAKGVIHLPFPSENPSLDPEGFILGETRWNQHLVCILDEKRLVLAAVGAERL